MIIIHPIRSHPCRRLPHSPIQVTPRSSSSAGFLNCDIVPPWCTAGSGVDGDCAGGFEPFRLAKIPQSLVNQAALFAELFWREHRRCVGLLLLLDRPSGGTVR